MIIYAIEIPNEKLKTYNLVTFIILTLNFLGFGYSFLQTTQTASVLAILGLLINAVPWLYYLLNKKHLRTPIVEITIIASAFIWCYYGNFWMGILLISFAVLGFFTNKKSIVYFDEKGITYPSFPPKKYSWAMVTMVVLKDDILTIDLKNNTLIQLNIDKYFTAKFDVEGFNTFCKKVNEKPF